MSPLSQRHGYYLALSYAFLGRIEEALLELRQTRLNPDVLCNRRSVDSVGRRGLAERARAYRRTSKRR